MRYLIPPYPPEDLSPASPTPQDFNIPDEAYGARTAFGLLDPGETLEPPYLQEADRANRTRAAELQNQFLDRQRRILHTGPNAFLTRTGRDAVLGANEALAQLDAARQETLDQAANPVQRRLLQAALGEHAVSEHYRIGGHVGEQSLEWQKQTALERLDQLRQQAAIDHDDPDLVEAYGKASEGAARELARTLRYAPDSGDATREVDAARSGVWRSAIQAALDRRSLDASIALHHRAGDRLTDVDAEVLTPQVDAARELQAGEEYVSRLSLPEARDPVALETAYRVATDRNNADWPDDRGQRATNQHLIDIAFGRKMRDLVQAKAELDQAVTGWLARPGQAERPPLPHWSRLDSRERRAVDGLLAQNNLDPPAAGNTASKVPAAAALPLPSPQTPQLTLPGAGETVLQAGRLLGELATRLGPYARALGPGIGAGIGAALPILFMPWNSPKEETVPVGDGLRARIVPDMRSVAIEKKTGTGPDAKWVPLDVDVTSDVGRDNRRVFYADAQQLKEALGAEDTGKLLDKLLIGPALQKLPTAGPHIVEMRIGVSADRGMSITRREATEEEVQEACPSYFRIKDIATQAVERHRAAGLPYGAELGRKAHADLEAEMREIAAVSKRLEESHILEMLPEVALREGTNFSKWRVKGSSVIDVLEIQSRGIVCVYDLKTGNAGISGGTERRYARAAGDYIEGDFQRRTARYLVDGFLAGYSHIYVVPVQVNPR